MSLEVVPNTTVKLSGTGVQLFPPSQYYLNVMSAFGDSIIGYWPLWDASGSVAEDISANKRNGVYTNVTLAQSGIGDGKTSAKFVTSPASKMNPYSAGLATAANLDEGFVSFWMAIDAPELWADINTYTSAFLTIDFTSGVVVRKSGANILSAYRRKAGQVAAALLDCPTTSRWFHFGFAWSVAQGKEWVWLNGSRKVPTSISLNAMAGSLAAAGTVFGSSTGAANNWPGRLAHIVWGSGIPSNLDSAMWTASRSVGQVVFDGDSRSADKNWTTSAVESAYPSGDFVAGGRGVSTQGSSGKTISTMLSNGVSAIDPLIKNGINTIVLWGGVNDAARTAQQIYDDIADYCTARKAAGWQNVVVCTEIDAVTAGWTAKYQAINALILSDHTWANAVADLGGDVRLQDHTNLTYYNADGVHLTAAGYSVVAGIVASAVASV